MPLRDVRILINTYRFDLDALRILAISGVVLIHCVAPLVVHREVGIVAWNIANFIDGSLSWCVPVFVMISGALLIKEDAFKNEAAFFKRRFSRILIPLLLWPVLYALFHSLLTGHSIDIAKAAKGFLMGQPAYGYQLYFLFLIAELYLLTPILSAYISRVSRKQLWVSVSVINALIIAWTTLGSLVPSLATSHNMFTQGLPYVGYFLLGFLLKDIYLRRKHAMICFMSFVIANTTIGMSTYLLSKVNGQFHSFFYEFTGLLAFISAVSIFLFIKFLFQKDTRLVPFVSKVSLHTAIKSLSKASFGVYLIHVMVLELLIVTLGLDRFSIWGVALLFPATLIVSWLLVMLLRKLPKASYLLG